MHESADEAPWTIGHPALREHDPVRVKPGWKRGFEYDAVAMAEEILEEASRPPAWCRAAHLAGRLAANAFITRTNNGVLAYGLGPNTFCAFVPDEQ